MKKILFGSLFYALIVLGCDPVQAGLLVPRSVSHQGTLGNSLTNATQLIDGQFPPEFSAWTVSTSIPWNSQTSETGVLFTIDYGTTVNIAEVLTSIDNNDTYQVDYSSDNLTYLPLLVIPPSSGEVGSGMDTLSSDVSHIEFDSALNFTAVNARFIRMYAVSGDGFYSIGEFQSFSAVPEPSAGLLVLTISSLVMVHRRRFN